MVEGSATDLPFSEAAFDRVYSQNVAMNSEYKRRFYAEVFGVLRPRRPSPFPVRLRGMRRAALPASVRRAGDELSLLEPRRPAPDGPRPGFDL